MKTSWPRLLTALCLLGIAGCGEVGGGASVVPEVTFLPAEAAVAANTDGGGSETSADTGAPGSFSGKVVLTGTAPQLRLLVTKGADIKDKEVCAAVDVADERLVLGAENGVANVFIYLEKAPKGGKALEVPSTAFDFDQEYCRFFPHASVVPTGQVVRVLSKDSITHNTHTYPARNDGVSTAVAPGDREGKLNYVFKKAEKAPFRITCDFHAWMVAYQLPLDHPYGTVTAADGTFRIPDLPAGKHKFMVWHEAADGNYVQRNMTVEIKAGENTAQTIEYAAEKLKLN